MYSEVKDAMLSGWGRFAKIKTKEFLPKSEKELLQILVNNKSFIARGNARSYGNSAVNKDCTINMTSMNQIIDWDNKTGELIAESGLLISDIIDNFLPHGWFLYVTPGTKFVTLGGAIACDVHGKNHHIEGSFGDYINWIEIIDQNNKVKRCSRSQNAELFNWTIGGMGLTGIILRCSIRLKKVETGWIIQRTVANYSLKETLESFNNNKAATYAVAWIDCLAKDSALGRPILMLGEHANLSELKAKSIIFPKQKRQRKLLLFNSSSYFLNNLTVSIFNFIFFHINKSKISRVVDWDTYFYPLDKIKDWNHFYNKKGFFQFQCILADEVALKGYTEIISLIQKKSSGSFLAVLKNFGQGKETLSFPKKGVTLSIDFKTTKKNILLAHKLTNIVNRYEGKIYLAKDVLMNSRQFNLQIKDIKKKFLRFRNKHINSEQSITLNL